MGIDLTGWSLRTARLRAPSGNVIVSV